MDPAREGNKFCVILIRNQPEVPDNFSAEPFQHYDSNQRLSEFFFFFFWTVLRNQLQSKRLRCCTYDSNLRPRLPTVVCALAPEPLLYVGLKTKINHISQNVIRKTFLSLWMLSTENAISQYMIEFQHTHVLFP